MKIYDEFKKIIQENTTRLSTALIMEMIDELSDLLCESFAKELKVPYEDVQAKLMFAQEKIKRKIQAKDRNAD